MIGHIRWMDRAICAALGGVRWEALTAPRQVQLCRGCPVRADCLSWTLKQEPRPRHGVVGGLYPDQRRNLANKIGEP